MKIFSFRGDREREDADEMGFVMREGQGSPALLATV